MDFFTNTYESLITTHANLDEKKRPRYQFRAATIKERREETKTANYLNRLIDPKCDDDVDDPIEYIEAVLPHISNRLIRVIVGKKSRHALMDLENTLDYTSIIELFWVMRNSEEMSVMLKKKSQLQLNSPMAESAKAATETVKEPQVEKAK